MDVHYDRISIKRTVKQMLKENWPAVLTVVLLLSVVEIAVEIVMMGDRAGGEFLSFLVVMPLDVALCSFLLLMMRERRAQTGDFFAPFSRFFKYLLAGIWYSLWLILWTLLLIVPGIVKFYAYLMYPYILADAPDADLVGALRTSKRMTNGYKLDLFTLSLTFAGWFGLLILAMIGVQMLVLGQNPYGVLIEDDLLLLDKAAVIAKIVTMPFSVLLSCYIAGVLAQVYESLKTTAIDSGVCQPEEFGLTAEQAAVLADTEKTADACLAQGSDDSSIYNETIGETLPEANSEKEQEQPEKYLEERSDERPIE